MKRWLLTLAACGYALTAHAADKQDFVFLTEARPLLIRADITVDGKPYQTFWDTYVDRVMKFLDTDKDGVLSKAEIERMPPAQLITGSGAAFTRIVSREPPAGSAIDADKDGKGTRDELAGWLKRHGARPLQFQMNDAGLNPYGVRVINLGQAEPVRGEELTAVIIALLDANGDGKLSREELAAAPGKFLSKDADDDEMVTPRELTPPGAKKPQGYLEIDETKASAAISFSPAPAADRSNSLVIFVNPGESGAAVAKRLLARYGPKDKQVKKLRPSDIGLEAADFARLDADQDGSLDAEELAQFARRAPDIDLTVRLGSKPEGKPGVEATSRVAGVKLEALDGGAVKLTVGVTNVELRSGEANSQQFGGFNFRLRDQYVNQFKMADTDNNNYIDEKEAAAYPTFRSIFKALDTDGDGMLYEKEMVAYLDRLETLQKAIREGCVTVTLSDKGSGLFEQFDANRDGRLSVREMRAAPALLAKLDADKDGQLARTEVPRNFEMRTRRGPAGSGDFGSLVVVARASFSTPLPLRDAGPGPVWFRKMDVNKDGDLSRREFLGPDEQFKIADADGDGLISVKEAEAAEKIWAKARK